LSDGVSEINAHLNIFQKGAGLEGRCTRDVSMARSSAVAEWPRDSSCHLLFR